MSDNQKENENQSVLKEESNTSSNLEKPSQIKTSTGLDENIAGLLCYLAGVFTGIIFLVIEKENRFVRFHALQSIFVFVVLLVVNIVLGMIPLIGWLIGVLLSLISVALWIILMLKAYQRKWFKLPFVGDMAEKQANNMEQP